MPSWAWRMLRQMATPRHEPRSLRPESASCMPRWRLQGTPRAALAPGPALNWYLRLAAAPQSSGPLRQCGQQLPCPRRRQGLRRHGRLRSQRSAILTPGS